MLDLFAPDALRDVLISISGAVGPRGWRRVVLTAMLGFWLWGLARGARALLLRLDLALATRARRDGREPGTGVRAVGQTAVWLPAAGLALAGLTLAAEVALAVDRTMSVEIPDEIVWTARKVSGR